MKVLQHYYTSFVNRETGRAGFQVKAMTPGISAEMQATIARLIAYRIPNDIEERAIGKHPIAFRYFYHTPQECILLCSQSSGDDENGRPGNFFAHSVVMSPDELANQPPILYWRSPFWRKQAAETQIKALTSFDAEMSLYVIDEMWTFLADPPRKEAFYKLMCAVIHSERTKRRIIIIDSDNHVALWIAAVSCMLPPAYRPLLSFATYHHDPYQSWFLITGTPDDSVFRSTPEESVSHFVLDGRTCRTSSVEDSQYAKLIRDYTSSEHYEKRMLPIFVVYEQRFPKPTSIDEQLDLFADFIWLRRQKDTVPFSPPILAAVNVVLTAFEGLSAYSDVDRQELVHLEKMLEDARQKSRNVNVLKAYERVVRLYQKHNIPTNELLQNDLRYYTELLLEDAPKGAPEEAITMLKQLHQTYSDDLFVLYVNQRDYLQYVVDTSQNLYQKLCLIWTYIGPYIRPGSQSQHLFGRSIQTWDHLRQSKLLPEAKELFTLIKNAINDRELEWLQILVDATPPLPDIIERFYWQLVSELSIEQREPYRAIVQRLVPTIVKFELGEELAASHLQSKIAVISRWVTYATKHPGMKDATSIVSEGLELVQGQCSNKLQWRKLTLEVLLSDDLLPFLGSQKDGLVKVALSELTFQEFVPQWVQLYKCYKDHASLSSKSKNVLAGMVAMSDGSLDAARATQISEYISGLASSEQYYQEIYRFIDVFFEADITEESHFLMVSALYVWSCQEKFWLAYWSKLHTMLTRLLTDNLERAVRLFSFWFALLPNKTAQLERYYVVQQFFLGLRQHMIGGRILDDYSKALNNLSGKAAASAWYPLIQELFQVRKKGLVEISQEWMKLVQKKIPAQKIDEQAQEFMRTASNEVSSLLTKGIVREQHIQNLPTIYSRLGHELFWTLYTKQFIQLLTAKDIERVLEVYTFWFDESFNHIGQEPYIAQEFFIKVSQIFENALKEHERDFRETAKLVISHCDSLASRGERYGWYPLIRPFFVEALSNQRRPR